MCQGSSYPDNHIPLREYRDTPHGLRNSVLNQEMQSEAAMHTLFPLSCTALWGWGGDNGAVILLHPMATDVCPDVILSGSSLFLAHVLTPSLTPHRWANFYYRLVHPHGCPHSLLLHEETQPSSGKGLRSKLGGRWSRHERDPVLHQALIIAFLTAARLGPAPSSTGICCSSGTRRAL